MSAIVAMVLNEPSADWCADQVADVDALLMTTATAVETMMVTESRTGIVGSGSRKGNHPGGLNYGDCFSYALASTRGVPLLCVEEHFKQTDLDVWAP